MTRSSQRGTERRCCVVALRRGRHARCETRRARLAPHGQLAVLRVGRPGLVTTPASYPPSSAWLVRRLRRHPGPRAPHQFPFLLFFPFTFAALFWFSAARHLFADVITAWDYMCSPLTRFLCAPSIHRRNNCLGIFCFQ